MSPIDLRRLDLNLLKAFEAIERDRSVTRAADRLGIGQSAMSHALARLRDLTGDMLFIRTTGGMQPTATAQRLIGPIRSALAAIDTALNGERAVDLAAPRTIRLGLSDVNAAILLPHLLPQIAAAMPAGNVVVLPSNRLTAAALIDDETIDLAVGMMPRPAEWQRSALLYQEGHAAVFDPAQVAADDPITIDQFCAVPHLLGSPRGDTQGFVDRQLAAIGRARRVTLASPYFLVNLALLRAAPAITVLPARLARHLPIDGLRTSAVPLPERHYPLGMLWHLRADADPVQLLVRGLVRAALAD